MKESETWNWSNSQSNSSVVSTLESDFASEGDSSSKGDSDFEGDYDSEDDIYFDGEYDFDGGSNFEVDPTSKGGSSCEGVTSEAYASKGGPSFEGFERTQIVRHIPKILANFELLQDNEIDYEKEVIQSAMMVDSEPIRINEALKNNV